MRENDIHGFDEYLVRGESSRRKKAGTGRSQSDCRPLMGLCFQIYLKPAPESVFITLPYPDKSKHPRQKYLLTVKGASLSHELRNA